MFCLQIGGRSVLRGTGEGKKFILNLLLLEVRYAAFTTESNIPTKTHQFPFIFNGVVQLRRESTHHAADFRRRPVRRLVTTVHVFSKLHDDMQHSVSCDIIYVRRSSHPLHRHHAALTTFIARACCGCSL